MTAKERGEAIRKRREAHGFTSVRQVSRQTGLARDTVTKAEEGTASEGTYRQLEAWLDAYDYETSEDEAAPAQIEQIEFTVEGDFGVKVTVKGPITDRTALEDSVTKIIRSIRESSPDKPQT